MKNFKLEIEKDLEKVLNQKYIDKKEELKQIRVEELVEKSSNHYTSDYSIVCFKLAKILKQSPNQIAEEIYEELKDMFSDKYKLIENTGGYINIWIKDQEYINEVLGRFKTKGRSFGKLDEEELKQKLVIDYSSPNIAKQFHIGHLKTTVIGQMFVRLHRYLGNNITGVNHLGDYGTQFGKMIEGYNLWKDEYDFSEDPINVLNQIYIRINNLCKEDEQVLEKCRENFKRLEEGDEEITRIWKKFVELSMKEFNKIYELLNVEFDEIRGEAAYSKDLPGVVKLLEEKNLLVDSEGAKVIDLEDEGLGTVLVLKNNGSTLYITRDIATAIYRSEKYDYDKSIYVVASEQILHFKQLKEILRKMGMDEKYVNGIYHLPYGMIRLETGKMSTREGNVIRVEDLLKESITRTKEIIEEKENDLTEEEKNTISRQVGVGAVIFSNLQNTFIKDQVFKWENILNFTGETAPYIQYIGVRINSILREAGYKKETKKTETFDLLKDVKDNIEEIAGSLENINTKYFENEETINLIKKIYEFKNILLESANKDESYILTSYLLELSKLFNEFYSKQKVLTQNKEERNSKLYLIYIIYNILEIGMNILGIEIPDKM